MSKPGKQIVGMGVDGVTAPANATTKKHDLLVDIPRHVSIGDGDGVRTDWIRGGCGGFRERHHVQVSISTSGAGKHEVPTVRASRREVVAGLVSQARNLCFLSFPTFLRLSWTNGLTGVDTHKRPGDIC